MRAWTESRITDGPALRLVATETGLCAIEFIDESEGYTGSGVRDDSHPLLVEAISQLRAYFDGDLRDFRLPLEMAGTDFQLRVWNLLREIPYGETRSYRDLAAALGTPQAVRAVGAANGANPLAIVVPCHRVIGSDGKLTGYGGGLALKKKLLELESGLGKSLLFRAQAMEI
jgi:methylated-DNA-[protein]-cysteine S-methyltransferase